MLQIHPNARTTPVTRAEIARSHERTGILAQRYGVSTETIRKWRKRGASDCLDHSARPASGSGRMPSYGGWVSSATGGFVHHSPVGYNFRLLLIWLAGLL
jgi:hypothetical protein